METNSYRCKVHLSTLQLSSTTDVRLSGFGFTSCSIHILNKLDGCKTKEHEGEEEEEDKMECEIVVEPKRIGHISISSGKSV